MRDWNWQQWVSRMHIIDLCTLYRRIKKLQVFSEGFVYCQSTYFFKQHDFVSSWRSLWLGLIYLRSWCQTMPYGYKVPHHPLLMYHTTLFNVPHHPLQSTTPASWCLYGFVNQFFCDVIFWPKLILLYSLCLLTRLVLNWFTGEHHMVHRTSPLIFQLQDCDPKLRPDYIGSENAFLKLAETRHNFVPDITKCPSVDEIKPKTITKLSRVKRPYT